MADLDDHTPLLATNGYAGPPRRQRNWTSIMSATALIVLFLGALGVMLFYVEAVQLGGERGGHGARYGWTDRLPSDPREAAEVLLQRAPVIVRIHFHFYSATS